MKLFLHIMRYIKECLKKNFRNLSMKSVGESAGLMKCGFFLAATIPAELLDRFA